MSSLQHPVRCCTNNQSQLDLSILILSSLVAGVSTILNILLLVLVNTVANWWMQILAMVGALNSIVVTCVNVVVLGLVAAFMKTV